jgi:DNA-binding NarL/FixJ family response regulator
MSTPPVRIAVASDFAAVADGIARFLLPMAELVTVGDPVPTGAPVPLNVDIVLYDTFGRTRPDGTALAELVARPEVRCVAVHAFDAEDEQVDRLLEAGARGVLSKSMSSRSLAASLVDLAAGEQVIARSGGVGRATREERGWPGQELGLSEREAEVVVLAAVGQRNAEIAAVLAVSVDTVKTHLARSFRKLDVHNRTALSALVHTSAAFGRLPAPAIR